MITHKAIFKNREIYYLCNQAVKPTESKLRHTWKAVTCKNCLKQKRK
jgi:hypothetical protein